MKPWLQSYRLNVIHNCFSSFQFSKWNICSHFLEHIYRGTQKQNLDFGSHLVFHCHWKCIKHHILCNNPWKYQNCIKYWGQQKLSSTISWESEKKLNSAQTVKLFTRPSISDWVLCKKGLDRDNSYSKFLSNFRKRNSMWLFSADTKIHRKNSLEFLWCRYNSIPPCGTQLFILMISRIFTRKFLKVHIFFVSSHIIFEMCQTNIN